MNRQKSKYHGHTKQSFLTMCARNVILQVPYEQDHLLLDYCSEIGEVILSYLSSTTRENLEMIYKDKFVFKMTPDEAKNVFHMKFEYIHN